MKKIIALASMAVLIGAGTCLAVLPAGPTAQNGNVMQGLVAKAEKARCKTTAAVKGSFVNISTAGSNAITWRAFTPTGTAGTATAATVKRAWVTGSGTNAAYMPTTGETDVKLQTSGTYTITKARFTNYTGAVTVCTDGN